MSIWDERKEMLDKMKRIFAVILSVTVSAVLLCINAAAAEQVSGIYDAKPAPEYSEVIELTPVGTAKNITIDGQMTEIYEGAEKILVNYKAAVKDGSYVIIGAAGEKAVPTEKDIVYMNQAKGSEFVFFPKKLKKGNYRIYMAGADFPCRMVAAFKYYTSYMPGDVDSDNAVTAKDASMILQHLEKRILLTGNSYAAATVSKGNELSYDDARLVLKYATRQINSFPVEQ